MIGGWKRYSDPASLASRDLRRGDDKRNSIPFSVIEVRGEQGSSQEGTKSC